METLAYIVTGTYMLGFMSIVEFIAYQTWIACRTVQAFDIEVDALDREMRQNR